MTTTQPMPVLSAMLGERKTSILIVGLDCFVGDTARGLLNPVLWPLVQRCGGGTITLGFLVSTFSVGRVLVSTEIGRFADESVHRHRGALLLSGAVLIAGLLLWANVLYAGGLPTLFIAQFLMGLGTGNLGVLRSYVAEQALPTERTWQLARLSALQYAGFAATPVIGAALFIAGQSLGGDSKYCFPAYLVLLAAIAVQLLLWKSFKNFEDFVPLEERGERERDEEKGETDDSNETSVAKKEETLTNEKSDKSDKTAQIHTFSIVQNPLRSSTDSDDHCDSPDHPLPLNEQEPTDSTSFSLFGAYRSSWTEERELQAVYVLFIFLNFTTRGVLAMYESVGTALLLDTYGFTELQTGLLISLTGLVGTMNLLLFKSVWTQYFSNMTLMLGGFALMLGAQLLIINYGRDAPHPLWQYALSLSVVYAVGYPLGNSAVLGLFSILNKQGRQGRAQGHFALMGSVARILMPVMASYANRYLDPLSSFALGCMLMSASLFGVLFLYDQIIFFQGDSGGKRSRSPFHVMLQNWGMTISGLLFLYSFLAAVDFFEPKL